MESSENWASAGCRVWSAEKNKSQEAVVSTFMTTWVCSLSKDDKMSGDQTAKGGDE
jgi:hypothetical protein